MKICKILSFFLSLVLVFSASFLLLSDVNSSEDDAAANSYQEYKTGLLSVPEEILALPTDELLAYFLDSEYMKFQYYNWLVLSTPDHLRPARDFTEHPAFAELLTRTDFFSALCNLEDSMKDKAGTDEYFIFQGFLGITKIKERFRFPRPNNQVA